MTESIGNMFIEYSFYLIGFIVLFLIIGIFAFLSKFALFRFIGRGILLLFQLMITTLMTCLFIVIITGVLIGLIFLGSYQFDLFLANGERMMFGDGVLIPSAAILAVCFVLGGVLGSLLFSILPLSNIAFILLIYSASAFSMIGIGPIFLKQYVPGGEISFLSLLLLCVALPIIGMIYAIATNQNRKEALRKMTWKEEKSFLNEERRRHEKNDGLAFPWIKHRRKQWKETS